MKRNYIEYKVIHLTDVYSNMDNHKYGLKCHCLPDIKRNNIRKEIFVIHKEYKTK